MNSVKAVIFDMDGLMLDTERISQLAWQLAGKDLGVDIPSSILLQVIGLVSKDIKSLFKIHLGEKFPVETFVQGANKHYHKLLWEKPIPVKKGLFDLLTYLENRNIPKGVATSTRKYLARLKLDSAGLSDRFNCIVAGDEVKNGKPAPDIFLRTADILGVAPDLCLVLEDSAMGVEGACAAEMKVIMITDLILPNDELRRLAHGVFDSLQSFLQYLIDEKTNLTASRFTPASETEDSLV